MSRLAERLLTLKASQLRHITFLLGLPSTGTKTELSSTIQAQLKRPAPPVKAPNRILSIDMGIKNLGLCVLESINRPPTSTSNNLDIKVLDWRRINLLSPLEPQPSDLEEDQPPKLDFSPSVLSRLAVDITERFLTTHKPDTILIERQRFRSGGAAAVQEWTLRVNMLESMLWATLECLRAHVPSRPPSHRTPGWESFPSVNSVLPARVAQFWLNAPPGLGTVVSQDLFDESKHIAGKESLEEAAESEDEPLSAPAGKKRQKSNDSKKPKIAVVQSWLASSNIVCSGDHPSHDENPSKICLEIAPAVQPTAQVFLHGPERLKRRNKLTELPPNARQQGFKRDDLADSMLQGVAWLRWRENERIMKQILKNDLDL